MEVNDCTPTVITTVSTLETAAQTSRITVEVSGNIATVTTTISTWETAAQT